MHIFLIFCAQTKETFIVSATSPAFCFVASITPPALCFAASADSCAYSAPIKSENEMKKPNTVHSESG
jgi:hypothetical protein